MLKLTSPTKKKSYIGYFKAVYSRSGLLSLQLAGYMLVVTQCQVAYGNILNEQTSFNPFPVKLSWSTTAILKTYEPFQLWTHTLHSTNLFCKKCNKNSDILTQVINYIFIKCSYYYHCIINCTRHIEKYTGKIIYNNMYTYSFIWC